jgi:flagellar basal body-associated protein FliL
VASYPAVFLDQGDWLVSESRQKACEMTSITIFIVIVLVACGGIACAFLLGRDGSRQDRQQEQELQKALFTLDRDEEEEDAS